MQPIKIINKYFKVYLFRWFSIIDRASSSNYLHNKYPKAIDITLFSQHTSARVLWCNISTERIQFNFSDTKCCSSKYPAAFELQIQVKSSNMALSEEDTLYNINT